VEQLAQLANGAIFREHEKI